MRAAYAQGHASRATAARPRSRMIDDALPPVNIVLQNVARALFPDVYAARVAEAAAQRARWGERTPLFSMGEALFPGQVQGLRLFEPRYR